MSITLQTVENLAPDQSSLNAAKKLLKPTKWPVKNSFQDYIWGHCQGSGANPYLTVVDISDYGYKCTCPSRKFPCKHALALMWMFAEDSSGFVSTSDLPEWVSDWEGRRRKSGKKAVSTTNTKNSSKNIQLTTDSKKTIDPEEEKKKQAAAKKRAIKNKQATDKSITQGIIDYEQWVSDQLRTGLAGFMDNPIDRCRKISARLVDAKATSLAARLDELPAKIMHSHKDMRVKVAINELSKTIWLAKAWKKNPDNPDVRRAINTAQKRDKVLENPNSHNQSGIWQVIAEHIETRRDGLISHSTWLRFISTLPDKLTSDQSKKIIPFALLQDYYPSSVGQRQVVTKIGDYLSADIIYYPSIIPTRGFFITQEPLLNLPDFINQTSISNQLIEPKDTPDTLAFFSYYQQLLSKLPWIEAMPYLLPEGRFILQPSKNKKRHNDQKIQLWWQSSSNSLNNLEDDLTKTTLDSWYIPFIPEKPLPDEDFKLLLASNCEQSFILWDGLYAKFGSSQTKWGQLA